MGDVGYHGHFFRQTPITANEGSPPTRFLVWHKAHYVNEI